MDRIRKGEQFEKQFLTSIPFTDISQIIAKFYHSDKSSESIVFVKNVDPRFPSAPLIESGNADGTIISCFFTKTMTSSMSTGIWKVEFEISITDTKTLIYKPTIEVFAVQPTTIS